jgi:predicted oxidoreductase
MKTMPLGSSQLTVPVVAVGAMRILSRPEADASRFIQTALDHGANFFDHADIYGGGECESYFAEVTGMSPAARGKYILQSKCGIHRGVGFDFSKEHILASVDGILKRLRTDYLDVLLLHRPDALMEPEEVAAAFDALHASGRVRHFGVSNQDPPTLRLLQKFVRQPLLANQLQLSITNATMIASGLNVNMQNDAAINRDGGVLNFCRLHDITIQPWSPFQHGFFEGVFLDNPKFPALNAKLAEVAARHNVAKATIVIAWLLRHPARFQPVTGTTDTAHLLECLKAVDVTLTRQEWYEIFQSAGNKLP